MTRESKCRKCSKSCLNLYLPEEVLEEALTFVDYEPEDNVIQQGTPIYHYHLLCEGYVKVGSRNSDGKKTLFSFLHRPGIIEKACLHEGDNHYPLFATAITAARVGLISPNEFGRLQRKYPRFAKYVSATVSKELQFQFKKTAAKAWGGAKESLTWILTHFSSQLNGNTPTNGGPCDLHLSEQDLAQMLGFSRETVVRQLSSLRKKGLVRASRGSVIVLDPQGLIEEREKL
ncbi:MAG: Crp/Fnr family transcriptional regulator [Candidatus Bipolaricaulota bacterium]